jgi:microcystin-dependent protein
MGQPYVGEIRIFCGNFAPSGWMFCQGQLIPISENETLFNLIGTTYGGDGETTFQLPDLQGRVPVHMDTGGGGGGSYQLGDKSGAETVTLTTSQIPAHSHVPSAFAGPGTNPSPANGVWAECTLTPYASAAPAATMSPAAIGSSGGSQPHDNMVPFLVVNFIISMFGVYPSQT